MKNYFCTEQDHFSYRLEAFQYMLNESKNVVFFGGAGVSTESGIPDFRSKDGLYNTPNVGFEKYTPEYLLSHSCLMDKPEVFFEFYRQKLDCRKVEPNAAHKKLAELEKAGKNLTVVTQNIDGLHQKAGSKNVLEVHGTTMKNYCSKCGKVFGSNFLFENTEPVPHCDCGGVVRPDVTLYEENLPKAFDEAYAAVKEADLLVVAGTSLTVYPAAGLVSDFHGKYLVVVNRDRTDYDRWADVVFRENVGEVLSHLEV